MYAIRSYYDYHIIRVAQPLDKSPDQFKEPSGNVIDVIVEIPDVENVYSARFISSDICRADSLFYKRHLPDDIAAFCSGKNNRAAVCIS